jgi:hypothetical protein
VADATCGRVALDADHLTVQSNQPRRQHRNVTRTRAKVEHAHPWPQSRGLKQAFGQRVEVHGAPWRIGMEN